MFLYIVAPTGYCFSQCGYTLSAYKALNEAHRLLGDEVVFLAVPSDEFKQELPTASEVSKFTKEDMVSKHIKYYVFYLRLVRRELSSLFLIKLY